MVNVIYQLKINAENLDNFVDYALNCLVFRTY